MNDISGASKSEKRRQKTKFFFEKQKKELNNWILWAKDCNLKRFNKFAETILNWYSSIINSLNTPYITSPICKPKSPRCTSDIVLCPI